MSSTQNINLLYEEAVELLKALISIPSLSVEEDKSADLIACYLEEKGVKIQRKKNNVWCTNKYFDSDKKSILLNSHHDTVKPNSGYTKDPFTPEVKEDKLYGLGSNDAGGALTALLHAFLYFYEKEDLPYNLVLLASAEEEISGSGGVESVIPDMGVIDCAIVGEPTEMNLAVAEKGLLVIDCEATGKAGHAAREEAINAIYIALEDISWFKSYRFSKVSDLLGPVKMSVTVIEAGKQHNMVPENCRFTVDIRINELYTHEEILGVIKDHVQSKIDPRSTRLRSSSISREHPLVKAALSTGGTIYGSPTLSDKALMPFPALKIGPGKSERSHTADEFILLEEIRSGLEGYIKILKNLQL